MAAVVNQRDPQVRLITTKQARDEIRALLRSVAMTRQELEGRGNAWQLDAQQRGVLADIRGLEFLIERATNK